MRGLYAGLDVFFFRCVALVGAQFTTYDWAKHHIQNQKLLENGTSLHIVASAIGAAAACVCMHPVSKCPVLFLRPMSLSAPPIPQNSQMDLIGSRLMNQPVGADGKKLLYSGPLDCLRKTVALEGPLGLYKGVAAQYMRMGPQYILTFVFFEELMSMSKAYFSPSSK